MEIEGYFTYYSARYSSATLALNKGADRNTVSHLLNHENFSTIDNYAGRADDSKVVEAIKLQVCLDSFGRRKRRIRLNF